MANDLWEQRRNLLPTIDLTTAVSDVTMRPSLGIDLGIAPSSLPGGQFQAQVDIAALAIASVTATKIEDFYVIEQVFDFNPGTLYSNGPKQKGYFATSYVIETVPTQYDGQVALCQLISTQPDTTVGQTAYTASTSYTFSGSIGVFGDQVTASASESTSFSHSTTVDIPDISVQNDSISRGNNARWIFNFNNNDLKEIDGSEATASSRDKFSPTVQAMWRYPAHEATPSLRMAFKTTVTVNLITVFAIPSFYGTPPVTGGFTREFEFFLDRPVSPA